MQIIAGEKEEEKNILARNERELYILASQESRIVFINEKKKENNFTGFHRSFLCIRENARRQLRYNIQKLALVEKYVNLCKF